MAAEARPLVVDLDVLSHAPHARALTVSLGDTKVLAQHASGMARDREIDLDHNGFAKRLYTQVYEPHSASTSVGKHSKKLEHHELQLSGRLERLMGSHVMLRHPNAISRVSSTLLDGDGAHVPAYVMATSLALARQGQLPEPYSCLEVALYEAADGMIYD